MAALLSCMNASAHLREFLNKGNQKASIDSSQLVQICQDSQAYQTFTVPESSSTGQFIDKVLIFEFPQTEYLFEFSFIKNRRYDFYLTLYMPEVDLHIHAVLVGMDADENTIEDSYELAEGDLIEEEDDTKKGGFTFTCPQTGSYNLTLTGQSTENTNVYFSVSDAGIVTSDGEMVMDVNGYHDTQERQYYAELKDDTIYCISIQRVTSLSSAIVSTLRVDVDMYDYQGRLYHLVRNQPIWSAFVDTDTLKEFGTAVKGQYRFVVRVDTDIPVACILFTLKEDRSIGDGPEAIEPTEPGENQTPIVISISTLTSFIPIALVFGLGAVFALVFIGYKGKKRTPKIGA